MIYLSKKNELEDIFFLRVLKNADQQALIVDDARPLQFTKDRGGHTPEGENMDLLKVWIKITEKQFPSLLFSEEPIQPKINSSLKKIRIKLINTKTEQIYDQIDFSYKDALVEKVNILKINSKTK